MFGLYIYVESTVCKAFTNAKAGRVDSKMTVKMAQ